jgi:hypothetical protein
MLAAKNSVTILPFTLEHTQLCLNPKLYYCLIVPYKKIEIQHILSSRPSNFVARFGVDGHPCVLRALCEAKERLKPGKSLIEDILHVVFT